ncbi:MAG: hypothetical protein ACLFP8_00430 [Alphaproteobacteria bacterium]
MRNREAQEIAVIFALGVALFVNVAFWFLQRDIRAQWGNVPPAPKERFATVYGGGDRSFSYRINGIMLQNMGDVGGRVTALKDYDYEALTQWFFLQDKLDPYSNYVPYLVSYYFSGVQEPELFRPALEYLRVVGMRPDGIKWNWLVQAIFFARHRLKDLELALSLADDLAKTENPDAPVWAKQMPAFVLNAKGSKEEAYALLVKTLQTNMDHMQPEEINAALHFICKQILDPDEASADPLCEGLY